MTAYPVNVSISITKFCFGLLLCLIASNSGLANQAASIGSKKVNNVRVWHSPDKTRVVFDVSADVDYRVFTLSNPQRVVVDIENADLGGALPNLQKSNKHIKTVRSGRPIQKVLRFVFELKMTLKHSDFVLTPNELYGYRLVVDLIDDTPAPPMQSATEPVVESPSKASSVNRQKNPEPVLFGQPSKSKMVVAIDAGHGGEDPGATGYRGSREKKLTLEIAKRLKKVVDADPRMQAVLIREGDYYVDLHKRRETARLKGADIFLSIHADAFTRRSARGLSVFALSQSGATSAMAKALAAKQNASDLIGGVSLADKDAVLRKVLVDLSMTNTISESVNLGGRVLRELAKVGKLHSKRVEQAGFAVLKSPDMPSILIETGFITNPEEERKLRSRSYQNKLVAAIHRAIGQYFEQTPYYSNASYASPSVPDAATSRRVAKAPQATPQYHIVVRGDSLSTIAEQYGISVRELKRQNNLRSNTAVLGKRLKLPASARAAGSASPLVHVVKRGDSLSKISAQYNITIRALKSMNKLSGNTLVLGQRLTLSKGQVMTVNRRPKTHRVKRGDTLSEIAEKYDTSAKSIMRVNKMRSQTVMLGQILKIPG